MGIILAKVSLFEIIINIEIALKSLRHHQRGTQEKLALNSIIFRQKRVMRLEKTKKKNRQQRIINGPTLLFLIIYFIYM